MNHEVDQDVPLATSTAIMANQIKEADHYYTHVNPLPGQNGD